MKPFRTSRFLCFCTVLALLVTGVAVHRLAAEGDALAIAPDRGAAGMARLLREIRTRASLALVVAHPDDEDGGMLVWESRGVGARAIQLTLNRGEGGQNEMSADTYDAMGLVRTQELTPGRAVLRRGAVLDPRHRLRLLEDPRRSAR